MPVGIALGVRDGPTRCSFDGGSLEGDALPLEGPATEEGKSLLVGTTDGRG